MSPSDRLAPDDPAVVAAIAAAVEVVWPRPATTAQPDTRPAWRFAGRWWARPVAARRDRPWTS